MENQNLIYLIPAAGIAAMIFALWKSNWISKQDPGNEKMQDIGLAIREGATAYIKREYQLLAVFLMFSCGAILNSSLSRQQFLPPGPQWSPNHQSHQIHRQQLPYEPGALEALQVI